jgi:hypothetical protein
MKIKFAIEILVLITIFVGCPAAIYFEVKLNQPKREICIKKCYPNTVKESAGACLCDMSEVLK